MPGSNNWGVSYSVIRFFDDALCGHSQVRTCRRDSDIYFTIETIRGRTLKVLLVNEYALRLASIMRARRAFSDVEYVVTGGKWNGYTVEAKAYGAENRIGVFNVAEFLRALRLADPRKYVQKDK